MNSNREDYLKIIFEFSEFNEPVTNKLIAQALDISKPSVSEMLVKLVQSDLVSIDEKQHISLRPQGELIAKQMISKHRIWESFLVNPLNYLWSEVHEDSEHLEHVTSERLLQHINIFLGYPQYCPHGSPIYINNPAPIIDHGLSQHGGLGLVRLSRVRDEIEALAFLDEFGLKINDSIEIHAENPDSYTLAIKGKTVECPQSIARYLYVK